MRALCCSLITGESLVNNVHFIFFLSFFLLLLLKGFFTLANTVYGSSSNTYTHLALSQSGYSLAFIILIMVVVILTTILKTICVKMPQMKLLPDAATLYCKTFSGVIITSLVASRSDYFRNFVDSCLQKIAQDRPTSDVLLKVRGIKRAVWCWTWEWAEACHCLFVREHLSDHAWGNLKCK